MGPSSSTSISITPPAASAPTPAAAGALLAAAALPLVRWCCCSWCVVVSAALPGCCRMSATSRCSWQVWALCRRDVAGWKHSIIAHNSLSGEHVSYWNNVHHSVVILYHYQTLSIFNNDIEIYRLFFLSFSQVLPTFIPGSIFSRVNNSWPKHLNLDKVPVPFLSYKVFKKI